MSMTETPLDDSINDTLPAHDSTGNAAYAAHFEHQRTLQMALAATMLCVVALALMLAWVARRPPVVSVIRIDEAGRAEAIHYDSLHYTPRESEVSSRLKEWAAYRYRLLKAVAGEKFKLNYYYLSGALAQKLMQPDTIRLAKILSGDEPEEDVEIDGTRFTQLSTQPLSDGSVASGEAVIDLTKIVNPGSEADRQHWTVTVKYEVNLTGAAKRGETDPHFLDINPLGVTITWFHEDRMEQ